MLLFPILCVEIITTITQCHGYVLFAANLDDFRSIAKKFIPEKLADQLAEMASESSAKYRQNAAEKEAIYEEYESEGESATKPTIEAPKTASKKRYVIKNQIPKVNIDEIVEKVREKLLNEKRRPKDNTQQRQMIEKNRNVVRKPYKNDEGNRDYSQNSYEGENPEIVAKRQPIVSNYEEMTTEHRNLQKVRPKIERNERVTYRDREQKEYKESVTQSDTEVKNQNVESKIFHEVDLRNVNDSYEDYATPAKEKIFDSGESKTTRKTKPLRQEINYKNPNYDEKPKDYDDVQARTESLLYDDRQILQNRTRNAEHDINTKKGKGTMIPTREYYKMSSPDYYKKLPVVAEKYDFNEPLPEKDREPETLKYIGNPPAKINKKVRV